MGICHQARQFCVIGLTGFVFSGTSVPASESACAPDQVHLRGEWGQARFTVELADDADERARGLMFRESLPTSSGMLFVYEAPRFAGFWMKNTLIPASRILVTDSPTPLLHTVPPSQPMMSKTTSRPASRSGCTRPSSTDSG